MLKKISIPILLAVGAAAYLLAGLLTVGVAALGYFAVHAIVTGGFVFLLMQSLNDQPLATTDDKTDSAAVDVG